MSRWGLVTKDLFLICCAHCNKYLISKTEVSPDWAVSMITNATMQTITCLPTWPWQFDLCLMLLRKQQNTKGCVLQSTQRLLPSAQNKYHHNVVNQCSWRSVFEDFNETSFREKLLRFRWRQQTAGLLYSEKVSSVLLTLQETDGSMFTALCSLGLCFYHFCTLFLASSFHPGKSLNVELSAARHQKTGEPASSDPHIFTPGTLFQHHRDETHQTSVEVSKDFNRQRKQSQTGSVTLTVG